MNKNLIFCLFVLLFCVVVQKASAADSDTIFVDSCRNNTDKDYVKYTSSKRLINPKVFLFRSARYTEFNGGVKGTGDVLLYSGGERTWFGVNNGGSYPDWKNFSGNFHIFPYKEVKKDCGFYGLVLGHGGKTFNPEDIANSLEKTNSELTNCTVTLHDGATLATGTGVRGARIAELNTEAGSTLLGPIKASEKNGAYFVLGLSGNDATLAGTIAPTGGSLVTKLSIIKEGQGVYRITGNSNLVTGAVRILEGKVMLNNDVREAKEKKLSGAIGALGEAVPGVYVFEGATIGGCGHSASVIDLYGNLEPGDNGIGTLSLADFATGKNVDLRLRPTSKLFFELNSAENHDQLCVEGNLNYWNIGQDFATSEKTPIIYILPTEGNTLKVGDRLTLITAKGKTSRDGASWNFRIQYPKTLSWTVREIEEDGMFVLVAEVTSLDYSGQGDVIVDNGNGGGNSGPDDDPDDDFDETTDKTPLRDYAEKLGKYIGVAAPCWSYNINNFSDPNTATIGREFNMIVSENGMKYENTEQSKNSFSYSLGDAAVNLGLHYNSLIRGHVFAWHKQNPAWVTENDNKNSHNYTRQELQAILKNHIFKVAEHFKGKVTEWDVVNECLSDDQTAIRNNPDVYDLRHSVWYDGIGEDFIDSAFVWAHQADPELKLYLTDYGAEFKGVAKTEALYNLAKRLKASNIPLHGVGLQCHLDAGNVDERKLAQTVESYESLGLECIITECDLGAKSTSAADLEQQAKDYAAVARVWLTHDNCPKFMIWGLKDSDSWRGSNPLLYDGSCKPKPAYYAVHRVLRKAVVATEIEKPLLEDCQASGLSETSYYNLQGVKIPTPQRGLYIEVKKFKDGTVRSSVKRQL